MSGDMHSTLEIGIIAESELANIRRNCANCDQSLKLCMVLDMNITFNNFDGYKLSKTCTHHLNAIFQDGRQY